MVQPVAPLEKPEELPDKCHVCWDGVSYADNQILYCEGCDVAVHQECYGVRHVPKGDWFCRVCEGARAKAKAALAKEKGGGKKKPPAGAKRDAREKKKKCFVCDAEGGALKPVAGGRDRWCHLFCSNWMPELYIKDLKTMEPVGGAENIDADRATLRCEVCAKPKGTGSCIQCSFGNCSAAYHPLCAALSGKHCMEIRSDMNEDGCEYKSYCLKHSKSRLARPKGGAGAEARAEDSEDEPTDESEDEEPPAKQNKKSAAVAVAASTPETLNAPEPSRRSARGGRGASEPLGDLAPPPTSAGKENEPSVSSPRKAGVVANGGVFGVTTDEPPPPEALPEHTVRALRAPPPTMPTEPESAKPEEERARGGGGGEKSASLKPPKCAVCASHKKGVCGTATAPLKCARRRENEKEKASSSDLRMDGAREAGTRAWDVAADGPPPPAPAAEELKTLERFFGAAGSAALAPEDEIVGELLQAHCALARASWVARALAGKALRRARDAGAAAERAAREEKAKWLEETSRYEERWRGGRWREEYLRRRGLPSADDNGDALADAFGDAKRELVDPLVETGAMEDALCAVCGGGESEAPNEIVFCERCELAVHQDCYGVATVPEGDWLCWPCHVAEANENDKGQPLSRPPRWLREAGDGALYDPRPACAARCAAARSGRWRRAPATHRRRHGRRGRPRTSRSGRL